MCINILSFFKFKLVFILTFIFILLPTLLNAQVQEKCPEINNKRADKIYNKAINEFIHRNYSEASRLLKNIIDIEPEFVDAYFVLGLINIEKPKRNTKAAEKYFLQVNKLCPYYDVYSYFYLADIYFGAEEYEKSYIYLEKFLDDVDKIRSDKDYNKATEMLKYAKFYDEMIKESVPFDPLPVKGISTSQDEYLPILSPDNEVALFTRRVKIPPNKNDLIPRIKYKEKFIYSEKENGQFNEGIEMPFPFNRHDNEGGATLTIDNKQLFYTLCLYAEGSSYYNCDIYYSDFINGQWSEIVNLGENVNLPDAWDSQPSITSDGNTLYFVSDRKGGYGGYDIYKVQRDENEKWGTLENLGPTINTGGNEKSPFIHTDSQTLYFSSDGLMGMGGYDIFFSKLNKDSSWTEPKNIGYPINSYDDDVGFFVSTDGHYGYFASNKFNEYGGWDLYSFDLYNEAQPEKVLFLKGKLMIENNNEPVKARIELKNVVTKKITEIPVDSITGHYAAAVLFRNDYLMTVKKKGFVYESKYISRDDTVFKTPAKIDIEIKPIKVGKSYRLNDIYFDFNSYELTNESIIVINEFIEFLNENLTLKISIQGHTDNIGSDYDNLILSQNRAKSVYFYLINEGIDSDRLNFTGFGEQIPIASNQTDKGRALNRRTEFVILSR